jgi:hypothetical protein
LRRILVHRQRFVLPFGKESGVLSVEAGHDRSLIANEQNALSVHLYGVCFDLIGQAWFHAAVVPEQVQGRGVLPRRELKTEGAEQW